MAAKAWSTASSADNRKGRERDRERPKDKAKDAPLETMFVSNSAVSLCLLMNRRAKTMRVIDFRAGPSEAKRKFVHELAAREGVEKMFTLVERDEVGTWGKLGFVKEGNIPGFYKRSDAWLLGCVPGSTPSVSVRPPSAVSGTHRLNESQMRMVAAGAPAQAQARARLELARMAMPDFDFAPPSGNGAAFDDADGDDAESDAAPLDTRAHDLAEKTLVQAKKRAKELAGKPVIVAKVAPLAEADARKAAANAVRVGRALTAFEPFGRDVERRYLMVTARGGFELVASIESQSCFGNAFLELLTAPKTDTEKAAFVVALSALVTKLIGDGVVSCFSLCPSDDIAMATAFVANGFRRTGLLHSHMVVGGDRKDAMIFSRKLANPVDD